VIGNRNEDGNRRPRADLVSEESCSKLREEAALMGREVIGAWVRYVLTQTTGVDERGGGAEGKLRETSDVFERSSCFPIRLGFHRPIRSEIRRAQALQVRVEQASRDVVREIPAKQYSASKLESEKTSCYAYRRLVVRHTQARELEVVLGEELLIMVVSSCSFRILR